MKRRSFLAALGLAPLAAKGEPEPEPSSDRILAMGMSGVRAPTTGSAFPDMARIWSKERVAAAYCKRIKSCD